jgi:hypothetical protein
VYEASTDCAGRDKLQEYNRLNEEIAEAMGSVNVGPPLDDTELEDELEALQQQELEDKMLETGAVPVDSIQRLPAVANGDSMLSQTQVTPALIQTLLIPF